jgi:hypothetical protein
MTAVPGWGVVAMGVTALVAAWLAAGREPAEWLAVWFAAAILALAIGGFALVRKAQREGSPGLVWAGRQFAGGFAPPMAAGIVLTWALYRRGLTEYLPGLWLLLYGTAVMTAGAYSVRPVPVMGFCFMVFGAAALLVAPAAGDLLMAVGFGGLHVAFGLVIARRHGG